MTPEEPKDMVEAMKNLSKTMAQGLRNYGIELTPEEALEMVREETLNGFRKYIRDDMARFLAEGNDT